MTPIRYNTVLHSILTPLLALILLFASSADLLAQSDDDMRWRFGLMGGVNTTSLIGAGTGFQKIGLTAGLVVHKPLSETSAFEMNLLFFQKGMRTFSNPEDFDFASYKLALNYLDLPLLYIYRLSKFEIEIGPSLGLLLSENIKTFDGTPPLSRDFNTLEIALNAGIRWHPADNFILGLRYHVAALPSQSVAPAGISSMRGRHNHGFVLFGTFLF